MWWWLLGCQPQGAALTPPEPAPWSRADERLALTGPLFERHPELQTLSRFAGHVQGEDRPDPSHRGAFGVGNGRAFALVGLTDPIHTLHGLVGPRYRYDGRFWGDTSLVLEVDGAPVVWEEEWIARPTGAAMTVTRAEAGGVVMSTVDFAPRPAGVDPFEVPPVILRLVQVEGADGELVIDAYDPPTEPVAGGVAAVDEQGRRLGYLGLGTELRDGRLAVRDGEAVTLALAFALDKPGLDALAAELVDADAERWLDETLADWRAWSAARAQLEVGDPWLLDWLDSLDVMVRVQTAPLGGVSPMSRYTGTWLRDTIGSVRLQAWSGRHEEAAAALEYLAACHAVRGDIGNSCTSGLVPAEVPPEPDWAALPPFSGRTAAEGPSHLPLMYGEVARWTGDHGAIDARWSYLERSVLAQTVTEGGLQPWSGDETFRLAMNVVFGEALEVPWQDLAWSSNSSYLMIAAADRMAAEARRRGEDDARWVTLRDRVRAGLDAFLQPEGHWAALLLRDPAEPPLNRPFEDANLMALWSGGLAPDDPEALANLEALLEVAGHPDGSVQSPPHPRYAIEGTDLAGGAATGMIPGYTLENLLLTGHPLLVPAFGQLLAYASPSGQYDEGVLYADRTAFSPVYDRGGTLGDVSARYRPWEGGINGAAAWRYLVGDGPQETDAGWVLRLAPRAPSGLDRVAVRGLRVRGVEVDVERRWVDGWEVEVRTSGPVPVALEVPLERWEDVDVALEGPSDGEVAVRPLGERAVVFGAVEVDGVAVWRVE